MPIRVKLSSYLGKYIVLVKNNWMYKIGNSNDNELSNFGLNNWWVYRIKNNLYSAQSCDLTNFCILGDFEQKMADNSDFKKTPHFICLKLNQICFTSLFCCCQVFICFKIKFLTTNVKTLITDYLMKIGFENPRFSLFSDAICSKS